MIEQTREPLTLELDRDYNVCSTVTLDASKLSKEEVSNLNIVLWNYVWTLEGTTIDISYELDRQYWILYLPISHESQESIEQLRKELIGLIKDAIPYRSILLEGFDI